MKANAPRPSGHVTFLFTDIEGSTRLWDQHPNDMRWALARHDKILKEAIDSRGGYVFSTAGDGLAAAFTRPQTAVETAVQAQRDLQEQPWPTPTPIRVRMGVHRSPTQEYPCDYRGSALNRTARLTAAAHGQQVLLSGTTAAMVHDVDLVFLGKHHLKDLADPEHVFQVETNGLQFAPLRTTDRADTDRTRDDNPGDRTPASAACAAEAAVSEGYRRSRRTRGKPMERVELGCVGWGACRG